MVRFEIDELGKSIGEEALATAVYLKRAAVARAHRDTESAKLWEHIADEESGHYREFKERRLQLEEQERVARTSMYEKPGEVRTGRSYTIEGKRLFPRTYGDWVNLAEDIKQKLPDDPVARATVNYNLRVIASEEQAVPLVEQGEVDDAKRWLVNKGGELGIS